MYEVDGKDEVVEPKGVPQSDVGAPLPIILSDEGTVLLAFRVQNTPENWDGTWARTVSHDTVDDPLALFQIDHYYAFFFGPPNDEAFNGHPLYERGLEPYSIFEVKNSSWLRTAERRNSVHPYHKPERFYDRYKHFVFSFHDSTFECLAESFKWEIAEGSLADLVGEMQSRLFKRN